VVLRLKLTIICNTLRKLAQCQAKGIHPTHRARKSSRTLRISEVGPPRGDFFFALRAWRPWAWSRRPHAEPLRLFRNRRAACCSAPFSCAAPRLNPAADRHVLEAPGSRLFSREKSLLPGQRFRRLRTRPRPFAGARSLAPPVSRSVFSARGARPDALLDCHAAAASPVSTAPTFSRCSKRRDHPRWLRRHQRKILETTRHVRMDCSHWGKHR